MVSASLTRVQGKKMKKMDELESNEGRKRNKMRKEEERWMMKYKHNNSERAVKIPLLMKATDGGRNVDVSKKILVVK